MFTLEQMNDLHGRFGRAKTLTQYISELRAVGVERYDSYVFDGHSEYFGGGQRIPSPPAHQPLFNAEKSDREAFLKHLKLHEEGQSSYIEMSRGLADSGIEKWTVDTVELTMTYFDRAGNVLLVEHIE